MRRNYAFSRSESAIAVVHAYLRGNQTDSRGALVSPLGLGANLHKHGVLAPFSGWIRLEFRAILGRRQEIRNGHIQLWAAMRYLKTSEAAALLKVSPNTLRAWERRFGFPKPQRSPGKHRLFTHGEIAALRDALQEGLSISSAVSRAREGLAGDTSSLVGALTSYDRERADAAIEAALALRSVERSVREVVLPGLDDIVRRYSQE